MRKLTIEVWYADEGSDLVEDREMFADGGFKLVDLLERRDWKVTGVATHLAWDIVETDDLTDHHHGGIASELDSAATPRGAFIDR